MQQNNSKCKDTLLTYLTIACNVDFVRLDLPYATVSSISQSEKTQVLTLFRKLLLISSILIDGSDNKLRIILKCVYSSFLQQRYFSFSEMFLILLFLLLLKILKKVFFFQNLYDKWMWILKIENIQTRSLVKLESLKKSLHNTSKTWKSTSSSQIQN